MSGETILKIDLLNRRDVLRGLGGLLVGFVLPIGRNAVAQRYGVPLPVKPNAYIHIDSDNVVTFVITKVEMGQGTVTSLSQILADELDCDWNCVRTEFAPVDPSCYGPMQGVFGSTSIRTQWMPLRKAGAAARQMLMEAAAQKWNIDVTQVRTEQGFLLANGHRISYGSVAEAAAKLAVPANIQLKDAKDFRLIGMPAKRLDTRDKISGATKFGIDAEVPGMLYATPCAARSLAARRQATMQAKRRPSQASARLCKYQTVSLWWLTTRGRRYKAARLSTSPGTKVRMPRCPAPSFGRAWQNWRKSRVLPAEPRVTRRVLWHALRSALKGYMKRLTWRTPAWSR